MRRLVLSLVVAALAACGAASEAYPPQYRANFMQACEAGAPGSFCGCVWARIEAEIPVRDFTAYDRAAPAAREAHPINQQMKAYFQACLAQTQTP